MHPPSSLQRHGWAMDHSPGGFGASARRAPLARTRVVGASSHIRPWALLGVLLPVLAARQHQRMEARRVRRGAKGGSEGEAAAAASDAAVAWQIGAASCAAYFLVYFFRYPIFMLPESLASAPVGGLLGASVPLKDALSSAFILGFALAKFPAVKVMSSELYMNNRFAALALLNTAAAALGTLPLALTGSPTACVLGVFAAAFPASWVFGGLATYLEGRRSTEVLFAALTSSLVFAGSASRGAAQAVLDSGLVEPAWMPPAIAALALPAAIALLRLLDGLPAPSAADLAARGRRGAATPEQSWAFASRYLPGLALFMLGYAALATVRQFRDLFARDLLAAAFDGAVPGGSTIFFLDAAGGAVAFAVLLAFSRIAGNKDAMLSMVAGAGAFTLLTVAAVQAFAAGAIGGLAWQVSMGVCIFGGFACMQAAFFDRLVAVSGERITCAFLIFVTDLVGYVGTIALFAWKLLGSSQAARPEAALAQFTAATSVLGLAGAACLAGCWWYFSATVPDEGARRPGS